MKKVIGVAIALLAVVTLQAQEIKCKAIVNAEQIPNIDRKIFKTLEQGIENFVNTRKWTKESFEANEKIEVVYSLLLTKKIDGLQGGYTGTISIQATRPVYNTSYASPTVNYVDKNFTIKYIQFQPLDFNDNNVAGSDALASNLTAIIAYYTYLIIGLDYDSFSPKGGTPYYNKALNIVNNAPESRYIAGWSAGDSKRRNRYWLLDQLLNNRFAKFRSAYYQYHRLGLDNMITKPKEARANINKIFSNIKRINQENPSSVLLQFFFNAKSEEILDFIKNSDRPQKEIIIPICASIDVRNAQRYFKLMRQ